MTVGRDSGTQRRESTPDQLRRKLELLEEALEAISDGFILFDAEDRLLAANARHHELFPSISDALVPGVEFETLLRSQLATGLFESARGHEEEWLASRLAQHRNPSGPIEQRFRNGRIIRLTEHVTPSGGTVAIRSDITDLRHAEEELRKQHRLLLDSIAEGVFGLDAHGRCTFANRACLDSLGYEDESELLGADMEALLARTRADETPVANPLLGEDGVPEEGAHADDELFRRRDGTRFPVSYRAHRLRQDDAPHGVVVSFLDTTETLRTREALALSEARLQQARKMEAIGQLAGGIAHDFNNMLATILGFTQLAIARNHGSHGDERLSDYFDEVSRAGLRARDLVSQLLAFSRGTRPVAGAVRCAAELVDDTLSLLGSTLPSSMRVRCQVAPEPLPVLMDPVSWQQLLMNLMINARDAMEGAGNVVVRLGRHPVSGATCASCGARFRGSFIMLEVEDSGTGIDDAALARMFDPFFTTKALGQGTGMGLSVVHGIVHDHGGHIEVVNIPSRGAIFRLLLPEAELPADPPVGEDAPAAVATPAGGGRILVVDDEPTLTRYLRELLQAHGHEVRTSSAGDTALEAFRATPHDYDAIITDQTMPGLTGIELARAVLTIRPDLPVFLCTGHSDVVDEEIALKSGLRGCFDKPYDERRLLEAVSGAIAGDR